MLRLTPVVQNLLIINVGVFILQSIMPVVTEYLALYNITTPYFKPYQLFTYMFTHSGFMHIFFNMLMFIFFGPQVEDFWGSKQFIMFYTICGVGAGLFNILINLLFGVGNFSVMIGASGAVYGVVTAFGILFPDTRLSFFLLPISFKAKYLVMGLGAIAIFSGLRPSAGDNTAHFAHLGGIVVAIILLQIWRRR
jgi:membrane associated rhomboid family serine protease